MKIVSYPSCTTLCLSVFIGAIQPASHAVALEDDDGLLPLIDLEEFLVTATKRERNAQELPMALTPFSAEQLEYAGVTDIRDLMAVSPSLFLVSAQAESTGVSARIRGIGTTGDNPGFESAVGVFVDGVYRSRNNIALTDLGEVERIEVLRGPQGTLFGRNTLMGLINVITKGPTFERSGYGEVEFANYNGLRVEAGLSGALHEDTVAGRFDIVSTQRDGILEDIATGDDYNNRNRWLARGQLLIKPGEDSELRIIADYADRREECCAGVTYIPGPTLGLMQALGADLLDDPFDRKVSVNPERGYYEDVSEWGISGEFTVDTPKASFTSLTAYRDWTTSRSQDIDYINADIGYRPRGGFFQEFQTFTQEFRVESEMEKVDWMAGLFFIDEDLDISDAIRFGRHYEGFVDGLVSGNPFSGVYSALTQLPPGQVFPAGQGMMEDNYIQKGQSWALFTHNQIKVSDEFEITLGLRYSEETKDLEANLLTQNKACGPTFLGNLQQAVAGGFIPPEIVPGLTGLACVPFLNPFLDGNYTDSRREQNWSSNISASYQVKENQMVYASLSRGFKAGGYSLDRGTLPNPLVGASPSASDLAFLPEKIDSFEVGGKIGLLDNRATLNATYFYMDLENFQLVTFTGTGFIIENVKTVTSSGVELESTARLTNELTARAGLTVADAAYGSNINNANLAGRTITSAPKWTYTASATYKRNLNESWLAFGHLDARYMSSYNTGSDLDIEKVQKGYALVNGRIGLTQINGNWSVELWAKNLLDEDYVQVVFDAPLQGEGTGPGSTQTFAAFLGNPRTMGLSLRREF